MYKSRLMVCLMIVLLSATLAFAQNGKGGLILGGNLCSFIGDDAELAKGMYGYNIGLYGSEKISNSLSFHLEVTYNQKGADFDSGLKQRLQYVDITVLFLKPIIGNLNAALGPYLSIYTTGKEKLDTEELKIDEKLDVGNMSTADIGLTAGLSFDFGIFILETREYVGFVPIFNTNESAYNWGMQVMLKYPFNSLP